jgi:hypothetical protein
LEQISNVASTGKSTYVLYLLKCLSPILCEDGKGNELLTPLVSRFLRTDMLSSQDSQHRAGTSAFHKGQVSQVLRLWQMLQGRDIGHTEQMGRSHESMVPTRNRGAQPSTLPHK